MKHFILAIALLLASPAIAEEAKPAPVAPAQAAPDDSTPVTLTYGELKALIAANVAGMQFQQAQAAAKEATEKLRAQLMPKQEAPKAPVPGVP